jgi:hypothetical protein
VVEVEVDDPPHAVSSRTSELSPVAIVHPLLRITSLLTGTPVSVVPWVLPGTQPENVTSLALSLITCHLPSRPWPFVLNGPAPLNRYRG